MKITYPIYSLAEARAEEARILGSDQQLAQAAVRSAGSAIGLAVLNHYCELQPWPVAPQVLLLLGKGRNCADALVAASVLAEELDGLQLRAICTHPEAEWDTLATDALQHLRDAIGDNLQTFSTDDADRALASHTDVVIDGIFGAGFRPPLPEAAAALLRKVNAADIAVRIAIDLPSGIGDSADEDSFVADFTFMPGIPKTPAFDADNARWLGRVHFIASDPFQSADLQPASGLPQLVNPYAFRRVNRLRQAHCDKRSHGHCLILAGSASMPGAALMATTAAVQCGAGNVTCLTPVNVAHRIAGDCPEAMWRSLPVNDDGALVTDAVRILSTTASKGDAILIGPGLHMDRNSLFTLCRIVRETVLPMILDASVLVPDVLTAILARSKQAGKVIVTPHHGEFNRLLSPSFTGTLEDKLIAFSNRYQLTIILKGPQTLICNGTDLRVSSAAGPVLARGGSGDILSGMLLARFAVQTDDPMQAAIEAVTWHSAAANALAQETGAIATRTTGLLQYLGHVLRDG